MKKQVKKILGEVFDSYEVLNKLWGYSAKEIMDFLKNKGVGLEFSIIGFRGGMDRYAWYKFTDSLPKTAWLDAITLKPKFKAKNEATGKAFRFTETELMSNNLRGNYRTVYELKAKIGNKRMRFQTEYENYNYVLSCECIAWLKRERLL